MYHGKALRLGDPVPSFTSASARSPTHSLLIDTTTDKTCPGDHFFRCCLAVIAGRLLRLAPNRCECIPLSTLASSSCGLFRRARCAFSHLRYPQRKKLTTLPRRQTSEFSFEASGTAGALLLESRPLVRTLPLFPATTTQAQEPPSAPSTQRPLDCYPWPTCID